MRVLVTRATALAMSALVASVGCGGDDDGVDAVTTEALVAALVTEADGVDLSSFGPVPMTSATGGTDDFYLEPPTELCDAATAATEFVAADDLYGYMGDGGDYRYADQWVTGETVDAAAARYASGVEALERCATAGELQRVEPPPGDVDEVVRYVDEEYPSPDYDVGYRMITYARNGGVIDLHVLEIVIADRYSVEQRDDLATAVLDRLGDVGRVEVRQ
jgi:hypothetical protein